VLVVVEIVGQSWCGEGGEGLGDLVENAPPAFVDHRVIVHFSRDPAMPPYGLISDATGRPAAAPK
jgi:hypothetical protein